MPLTGNGFFAYCIQREHSGINLSHFLFWLLHRIQACVELTPFLPEPILTVSCCLICCIQEVKSVNAGGHVELCGFGVAPAGNAHAGAGASNAGAESCDNLVFCGTVVVYN
jgi:hypothetical protein